MNDRLAKILGSQEAIYKASMEGRDNLKARYSLQELEALYDESGGLCQICGQPQTGSKEHGRKNLAIDHCHKSGRVRGLLCTKCNTALGKFNDDPELLRKAINYLLKNE